MTHKTTLVISTAVVAIVAFFVYGALKPSADFGSSTVIFKKSGDIVQVYTPKNEKASMQGLGGKMVLPEDYGMLWSYPQPLKPAYTMRGMKIPLDFIWIKEGKVVEIKADVPASRSADILPSVEVTDVLEVNAGYAARHKVLVGDAVEITQAWSN